MSVDPGFGGQTFIPDALHKIGQARQRIDQHRQEIGHGVDLDVDGGIKVYDIRAIAEAGVNVFVAGSAIFGSEDYGATVAAMHAALRGFHKKGNV